MKKEGLGTIRVIDFTTDEMGPVCSEYLALAGMEVIRVESPRKEKRTRNEKAQFVADNLNKKVVTIDTEQNEGKELLWRLIETADVFVENRRFKDIERLGFDYETAKERNPRLVYVSIKPFSRGSKWEDCPANEATIEAVGGATYLCGFPDMDPLAPGPNLPNISTCTFAANGAVAALVQREETGKGQLVEISAQEAIIAHSRSAYEMYHEYGRNARGGNGFAYFREMAPQDLYQAKLCEAGADASWVTIGCPNDSAFNKFCRITNREDMLEDERYSKSAARQENLATLNAEISKWAGQYDKYEIMDILLRQNRVTAGAAATIKEIAEDEDLRRLGIIQKINDEETGEMWIPAYPALFSDIEIKAHAPECADNELAALCAGKEM